MANGEGAGNYHGSKDIGQGFLNCNIIIVAERT